MHRCFCGNPSIAPCSWRGLFLRPVPVHELRVGDQVYKSNAAKARPYTIEGLTRLPLNKFQITYRAPASRSSQMACVPSYNIALVERTAICDAGTCEMHQREAGEHVFYCADHWNAWQEVA
jgi:hypothetical protein